jgi:uncharacterized protein
MADPPAGGSRAPGILAPEGRAATRLLIEVTHALPQRAIEAPLALPVGATVADALAAAAARPEFREIDLAAAVVGIFGVVVGRDQVLEPGDRVEIYRALAEDPKAARRARVKQARARRR